MALYTVTTTTDSDVPNDTFLSLREAIAQANATTDNDQIIFDSSVFLGGVDTRITLGSALPVIAATSVAGSLTITGNGAFSLTISGNNSRNSNDATRDFSIFTIASGGNLSISGVTVSEGRTTGNGGAFANSGTLSITNSTVSNNYAGFAGGGIRNDGGTLSVTNSIVSMNTAQYSAGISATGGNLNLLNSILQYNFASASGGGVGIFNNANVNIKKSTLSNNSTPDGDGIYIDTGSTLNLSSAIFTGDTYTGPGIVNEVAAPTSPYSISIPDLETVDDDGDSDSDNITSIQTPTFAGVGPACTTIELIDQGGNILGATTSDSSGNWRITSSTLSSGSYSIEAR